MTSAVYDAIAPLVSLTLSQSHITVFFGTLHSTIERTRKYPEELRVSGKIRLTQTNMNKLIGKVSFQRDFTGIFIHFDKRFLFSFSSKQTFKTVSHLYLTVCCCA
jgi:hypothetical protein